MSDEEYPRTSIRGRETARVMGYARDLHDMARAIKEAVGAGELDEVRWKGYVSRLESLAEDMEWDGSMETVDNLMNIGYLRAGDMA